jgi:glutamate racemase
MHQQLNNTAPLGVFDSGLGGLTVVRALRALLPHENIVYLGDTARVPYGTRSASTVVRYAMSCAQHLVARRAKAIIVACNTVSAVALEMLRAELDLPILGVIEPGAKAAVEAANGRRVGVLGTTGTVSSGAYPRAVAQVSTRIEVVSQAAPLLVPLVEEGWIDGEVPRLVAQRYLKPVLDSGARVILLGCTHYPILSAILQEEADKIAGEHVHIVDSAQTTARDVAKYLGDRNLLGHTENPTLEVLVTDRPKSFETVASRFLGDAIREVTQVDL